MPSWWHVFVSTPLVIGTCVQLVPSCKQQPSYAATRGCCCTMKHMTLSQDRHYICWEVPKPSFTAAARQRCLYGHTCAPQPEHTLSTPCKPLAVHAHPNCLGLRTTTTCNVPASSFDNHSSSGAKLSVGPCRLLLRLLLLPPLPPSLPVSPGRSFSCGLLLLKASAALCRSAR